jgi:hypothetical protein
MKYTALSLFVLTGLLLSCTDDDAFSKKENRQYQAGDLLVGFRPVMVNDAVAVANQWNLGIKRISGTHYISRLPGDSIDYVVAMLQEKPYLNTGPWKISRGANVFRDKSSGRINITAVASDMTLDHQHDWQDTMVELELDQQLRRMSFHLIVPDGEEQHWKDRFSKHVHVEWAELNYVVPLNRAD